MKESRWAWLPLSIARAVQKLGRSLSWTLKCRLQATFPESMSSSWLGALHRLNPTKSHRAGAPAVSSRRLAVRSTKQEGRERQGSEGAAEVSSADDVCEVLASTPCTGESTPSLSCPIREHMEHQGNPKEDCLSLLLWPLSSRDQEP